VEALKTTWAGARPPLIGSPMMPSSGSPPNLSTTGDYAELGLDRTMRHFHPNGAGGSASPSCTAIRVSVGEPATLRSS
jgi:hypothetical protein